MDEESNTATFFEHIQELRSALLRSFFIIFLGVILAFTFYKEIYQIILAPLTPKPSPIIAQEIVYKRFKNTSTETVQFDAPHGHLELTPGQEVIVELPKRANNLYILGPVNGFTITLKLSFWVGFILTSPFWLYSLFKFIFPALTRRQKHLSFSFIILSFLFAGSGAVFAYFGTIPLANEYLSQFNSEIGTNLWALDQYLNYTLILIFAHAFTFELGVVLLFLFELGVLSAEALASKRRHAIVGSMILAALITPPDVLTQMLVGIPMIILYELLIQYAAIREKFQIKKGKLQQLEFAGFTE